MSSPVNGVPASNSDDDMRRDLQNIQMQSNQVTDEVRVHSWNKMKSFEIWPQESGQALALLPRKIGFEHLGGRFSVSILPLSWEHLLVS